MRRRCRSASGTCSRTSTARGSTPSSSASGGRTSASTASTAEPSGTGRARRTSSTSCAPAAGARSTRGSTAPSAAPSPPVSRTGSCTGSRWSASTGRSGPTWRRSRSSRSSCCSGRSSRWGVRRAARSTPQPSPRVRAPPPRPLWSEAGENAHGRRAGACHNAAMARPDLPWWRSAAIYQVYIRSFADGSGDGVGDIAGLRARLAHLRDLGIDALWINPWYVSPMADAGYDVADYCAIDPLFGTLAEAEALIGEAHALGLRVIVDIVPNHCSDRHPWFQAALAAGPGSPERARFWFRPGRGPDGAEPPNDWPSHFGGPAWQRVADGEWYLHLFAPEQPDFNWTHPAVHAEFERVPRFWLDRGVDGFRIDVANALAKQEGLPDEGPQPDRASRPFEDQPEVHAIWREWRRIVEEYAGERMLVGEVWSPSAERLAQYLRPDELHTAFNFDCVRAAWAADELRAMIDGTLAAHALVGAPPTWVLSNHDVTRHVTRYGRAR